MKHKHIFMTLAVLLLGGSTAFAEISLKDLGDGNVDITFLYKDDTAPEMGVIGSFNNWTQPGEMMTKNDAGLWEKTIRASSADSITYKFLTKGTWIFDEKAPDKKDDGYGGNNGLIPVADILAGLIPMVPGAPPVVAKGPKKVTNQRPRVTFGTETYIESDTAFKTTNGELNLIDSAINAKSLWKFDGDLAPGMPGHLEVTVFNGKPQINNNGATKLDWGTGLQQAGAGFLLNPFYYLSDDKKPTLDKVRFGFDTPYLVYETGYANSTLPAHKAILWDTVSDANAANQGFSLFRLGPKARTWGDFTVDGAVVPNKSQDDFYGLYSWVSVEAFGFKVEGQYEMKSSTKTEVDKFFDKPSRQNTVLGAEAYLGDFVLQGQMLSTGYTAGGVADKLPAGEKLAYKAVAGYRDSYGDAELMVGYAYRGGTWDPAGLVMKPTTQMLYAKNDDVLGASGTTKVSLNGFQKFGYWGKAKGEFSLVQGASGNKDENNVLAAKPGFELDLDKLNIYPVAFDFYGLAQYNTKPAAGIDSFRFQAVGVKTSVQSLDVYYKFDNSSASVLYNTVMVEASVMGDLKAQAGVGLRTGNSASNALGLTLGMVYVVPAPEARSPKVYTQFVYNMDPYNGEGVSSFDLTDFGPTNGASGADGLGAFRFGLSWNY